MKELRLPQDAAATAFARKSLDGAWQPATRQRPSRFLRTGPVQQSSRPRFLPVSDSGPHPSLLPQQREKTVVIRHTSPLAQPARQTQAERVDFPTFSGDTHDLRAQKAAHDGSSPAGPHKERTSQPDENTAAADVSPGSGGSGIGKDTAGQAAAEPPESPRPPKISRTPEGVLGAPTPEAEGRERSVQNPTYREYLDELASKNFVQIYIEEEGHAGYDISDHTLHVRLTPTTSPETITSIAEEIEATTPFHTPRAGLTEEFTPLERLEVAIFHWGITKLPDQLGTDGWKEEPARRLGIEPGDTRSFREIVQSDREVVALKQQLREARTGADADRISELELAYLEKIHSYVNRLPYSEEATTPSHSKDLQQIDCVTAAFMGTFLSEVGIDYAVASIPTHAALIVKTRNGNLHWSNLQFQQPAHQLFPGDISGIDRVISLSEVADFIQNPTDQHELVMNVALAVSRRDIHTYRGDPRRWVIIATPGSRLALHTLQGLGESLEAQGSTAGLLFVADLGKKLSPNDTYLYSLEASAYTKMGEFQRARDLITIASQADPFEPTIKGNLGMIEYYAGNREASVAAYLEALDMDPTDHQSWQELGIVQASLLRIPQALESLGYAIALSPLNAKYRQVRGRINLENGPLNAALEDTLEAVNLEPENIFFRNQLARVHVARQEYDLALEQYGFISSLIDPANTAALAEVVNETGIIYSTTERYTQAIQAGREVLRLAPADITARRNLASYHDRYGIVLRRAGNESEATEQFSQAATLLGEVILLEPDDPVAYIRLAYVNVMQGNFALAETLLRQGNERITDEDRARIESSEAEKLQRLRQREHWEEISRGQ